MSSHLLQFVPEQRLKLTSSDGQKKTVYIYRFLTTNTIDEKIYQVSRVCT